MIEGYRLREYTSGRHKDEKLHCISSVRGMVVPTQVIGGAA